MYPPVTDEASEKLLLAAAADYAMAHGLVLRPSSLDPGSVVHAPYSLYPSRFPRALFEEALALQPLYNTVYANITRNQAFLGEIIGGSVAKVDAFQARLYDIYCRVAREGVAQPLHLGLFRSDYMVDTATSSLKQVEFNTISVSFGALSARVGDMHRHLARTASYPVPIDPARLPENGAIAGLAAGLLAAHAAFGDPAARIIFVVQPDERNAFDQRLLEYELARDGRAQALRLTFAELHAYATLDDARNLIVSHPHVGAPFAVSVVYYRSAYTPVDYQGEDAWATRLTVERSTAIKCPTVALQLAGCKKIQQVLAEQGRVEAFAPDPAGAARLRGTFAELYPLDATPAGAAALRLAHAEPHRFVLKPQREGGGNNIYRDDIPAFLDALTPEQQSAYILMDLIVPPENVSAAMVKGGETVVTRADVVSELGVYGVALFDNERVLLNETAGYLLRTKGRDSDEGGVAVGFSVIDSVMLE